ncbi:hypothetical protein ABK040_016201 [Willaertia magna]
MGGTASKLSKVFENPDDQKFLDTAFKAYDKDKSGTISKSEFDQFAKDIMKYLGAKYPDDKICEYLGPTFGDYWTFGSISSFGKNDSYLAKATTVFSNTLFSTIDKNNDGSISLTEWNEINWDNIFTDMKKTWSESRKKLLNNLKGTSWNCEIYAWERGTLSGDVSFKGEFTITEDLKIKTYARNRSGEGSFKSDNENFTATFGSLELAGNIAENFEKEGGINTENPKHLKSTGTADWHKTFAMDMTRQ